MGQWALGAQMTAHRRVSLKIEPLRLRPPSTTRSSRGRAQTRQLFHLSLAFRTFFNAAGGSLRQHRHPVARTKKCDFSQLPTRTIEPPLKEKPFFSEDGDREAISCRRSAAGWEAVPSTRQIDQSMSLRTRAMAASISQLRASSSKGFFARRRASTSATSSTDATTRSLPSRTPAWNKRDPSSGASISDTFGPPCVRAGLEGLRLDCCIRVCALLLSRWMKISEPFVQGSKCLANSQAQTFLHNRRYERSAVELRQRLICQGKRPRERRGHLR